jgi:hypothetical protein
VKRPSVFFALVRFDQTVHFACLEKTE